MQLSDASLFLALTASFAGGLSVGWWVWSLRRSTLHDRKPRPIPDAFDDKGALLLEPAAPSAAHKIGMPLASMARDPDLTKITGIDDVMQRRLQTLGVTYLDQIADWGPSRIRQIESQIGETGRVDREQWVSQARRIRMGKQPQRRREELV